MSGLSSVSLDGRPAAAAGSGRVRGRSLEWVRRYGPAEVGAVVGALLAAMAADRFGVAAATAIASALGEGIAFYAVILVRDMSRRRGPDGGGRILRRLLLEFGPAELLDTFAVRPLAMYAAAGLLGNLVLGTLAGKVAADVVFYGLAIVGYELGKSLFPGRSDPLA